jgi:outer membrane protein
MRLSTTIAATALLLIGSTPLAAQFTPAPMASAQPAAGGTAKIAFVNSAEILDGAPGAQEANDTFNKELQTMQGEIKKMQDELQALMDQYERQQLTLSASAKATRQNEITQKQQAYQTRADQLESNASKRQQELVQPVMDRVTKMIETMRVEGGYAIIFDVAGGSIIAADPALNLTAEVLRRLKAAPGR